MSIPPTIYALSTAPGRAGIAVIRVSGAAAGHALTRLAGRLPAARRASLRALIHPVTGEALDQAVVLWFPAPASFTGEDVAELHVHGGRAVIEAVLAALAAVDGLRLAEPGEFTRRAFDHDKLDLTEVEGLADLIDAETEGQRRQALRQASGALRALYDNWRSELIGLLARIEAELDFSDEADVPEAIARNARPAAEQLRAEIAAHLSDAHRGEILRDGFRVVLAGPPNVGKSSLLNALARRDAAIVSDEPGTTRDVIEVRLDLGGLPVMISDTAGLREAAGPVEQEGMRRTRAEAGRADLLLWLIDASAPVSVAAAAPDFETVETLTVYTKRDLAEAAVTGTADAVAVSAKTGAGLSQLTEAILERARASLGEADTPAPTRPRHRQLLTRAADSLSAFLEGDASALELRAEDLREAAAALGRLTGRIGVEDILDEIFSSFCIGK